MDFELEEREYQKLVFALFDYCVEEATRKSTGVRVQMKAALLQTPIARDSDTFRDAFIDYCTAAAERDDTLTTLEIAATSASLRVILSDRASFQSAYRSWRRNKEGRGDFGTLHFLTATAPTGPATGAPFSRSYVTPQMDAQGRIKPAVQVLVKLLEGPEGAQIWSGNIPIEITMDGSSYVSGAFPLPRTALEINSGAAERYVWLTAVTMLPSEPGS